LGDVFILIPIMMSRKSSHETSCFSFITTLRWYNSLYQISCIRQTNVVIYTEKLI